MVNQDESNYSRTTFRNDNISNQGEHTSYLINQMMENMSEQENNESPFSCNDLIFEGEEDIDKRSKWKRRITARDKEFYLKQVIGYCNRHNKD